jgi:HAD superfamily hydrolase (TIGR01509 family)
MMKTAMASGSPFRGVIFDVDGTLVDSNAAHTRAWVEAFAEAGHEVPEARVRRLIGMGGDKIVPEITGLPEGSAQAERIAKRRGEIFRSKYVPTLRPFPSVRDLLLRLRQQGLALAVATSAEKEELGILLRIAGADDLLAAEASSDDAERSKPDPDIVGAALHRLGVRAGEAVMIGDTPYDLEAAARAGITAIAFRCGGWTDAELAGAAAIYEDAADLLARFEQSPLRRGAGSAPPGRRTRPRPIDWICTPPFLVLFALIMGGFDVLQRIANLFGRRALENTVGVMQLCLVWAWKLVGTKIRVEQAGGLVPGRPYVFLANHQSMFDMPILNGLVFRHYLKYVAKRELLHGTPGVSYYLRHGGHAIIDRRKREPALEAIRELGRSLEERGVSALIYPEGTRARDGRMREFKIGGPLHLLEAAASAEVVPVAIDGSWRLVQHNLRPVPFGARVRVRIGAPLPRHPGEDRVALVRRAEAEIRATIARWRHEPTAGDVDAGEAQASRCQTSSRLT